MNLIDMLISRGGQNVRLIQLEIKGKIWEAAVYHDEGKTWTAAVYHDEGERIYVVGDLPACYRNRPCTSFCIDGKYWDVVGYMQDEVISEVYKPYHPFGKNWLLRERNRIPTVVQPAKINILV